MLIILTFFFADHRCHPCEIIQENLNDMQFDIQANSRYCHIMDLYFQEIILKKKFIVTNYIKSICYFKFESMNNNSSLKNPI